MAGCAIDTTSPPIPTSQPQIPAVLDTFKNDLTQDAPTGVIESNASRKLVNVRAYQFAFDPDVIRVNYGERVLLTVTSVDVGHGFALPDFGLNKRVPPEESVTFDFVADKRGNFSFFNPVYSGSGWKNMTGVFIVK